MYAVIDGLCFAAGVAGFVFCLVQNKASYLPIPIAWITLYPLLNETIYNICSRLIGDRVFYNESLNSRIVYHPDYNISFCGLEKLHPFDSKKYGNVFTRLLQMGIVKGENDVIKPSRVSRKLLLQKMSKFYLLKLAYSIAICTYIQMPLFFLPSFLLRLRVLNPMLLATQGTILASVAALKLKWAINLSGGYHHASFNGGGGFCVYPDISLAAHYLKTRMGIKKIMVIDLDAHQGNGHERDHIGDEDIFTVDAYNHRIYPKDHHAKQSIQLDISVTPPTTNSQYLQKISLIQSSLHQFKPQFVIYNAGTDCLIGDPLGNLSLTEEGIILRDQAIFRMCLKNQVPVVMVLSGGYQKENAEVIAKSIRNLYQKFDGY